MTSEKRGPICNMHIRYHLDPNPSVCWAYLVNVEDVGFLEVLPVSRGDNQWLLGAAGGGDDVIVVGEVHHLFDNVRENLQGGVPMGNLLMGDKLGLLSFFYFLLQIFSRQFPVFFVFLKVLVVFNVLKALFLPASMISYFYRHRVQIFLYVKR